MGELEDEGTSFWNAGNSNVSSNDDDSFEPLCIDRYRTPQQHAALRCILKEAVDFLFGDSMLEDSAAMRGQSAESSSSPFCTFGNQNGTLNPPVSSNDLND